MDSPAPSLLNYLPVGALLAAPSVTGALLRVPLAERLLLSSLTMSPNKKLAVVLLLATLAHAQGKTRNIILVTGTATEFDQQSADVVPGTHCNGAATQRPGAKPVLSPVRGVRD